MDGPDFNPLAGARPVGETARVLNALREEHRAFRSTFGRGFWVLTRHDDIAAAFQDPGLFSSAAVNARQVTAMFAELIERRRSEPGDDLVSQALTWRLDGEPIPERDLLDLCLLLFMAGLDTVTSQLSYAFWHLAAHPDDQQALREDPGLIPSAVEELMRAYSIVLPGRRLTRDAEVAGCPMKAGDTVMLPLSSANRDPRAFGDPDRVDLRREHNRHLGFATGPHRCLGSHLARTELRIALEEWHRAVPDTGSPPTGRRSSTPTG